MSKTCPDCGAIAHASCDTQESARCKFCCHVHRFNNEQHDMKCSASTHNLKVDDFLKFYFKNKTPVGLVAIGKKERKKQLRTAAIENIQKRVDDGSLKRCRNDEPDNIQSSDCPVASPSRKMKKWSQPETTFLQQLQKEYPMKTSGDIAVLFNAKYEREKGSVTAKISSLNRSCMVNRDNAST